jgi:ABC-type uncharacterized transport system substrate-binding protein
MFDYRFAPAGAEALALAKELVALYPDVILSQSTPVTTALQRETRTIPIVFAGVADPIGSGFVARFYATGHHRVTGELASSSPAASDAERAADHLSGLRTRSACP